MKNLRQWAWSQDKNIIHLPSNFRQIGTAAGTNSCWSLA